MGIIKLKQRRKRQAWSLYSQQPVHIPTCMPCANSIPVALQPIAGHIKEACYTSNEPHFCGIIYVQYQTILTHIAKVFVVCFLIIEF